MEKKKYPIGCEHYILYEVVGQGASAAVYRALCNPFNEIVAIKILDFERYDTDLSNISREAQTMILLEHPNVLKAHCSFVSDHNLWVVMPFMAGGSLLYILKAAYPNGLEEEMVIATILREALKGLEYFHQHGHLHRDVKAGNILVDARGAIKLGDFGVSAYLFDSGDRKRMRNTFVGTPCWMAPEVMEQSYGYDFKADIWSFGITALELAHGHAPFSKYTPTKVLLMTLQNAPPGLDNERDRKFSKSFKQMIASCLVKDPSKRPTAKKLLKHSFFRKARSNDYIARTILDGLPSLGNRIKTLKMKEEDMLAQKKMPDGKKEEISQKEYKRGLSAWNFDIEDLNAQASLIQDDEETLTNKEQGGSSCSSFGEGSSFSSSTQSQPQYQPSAIGHISKDIADIEDDDAVRNLPAHPPLADLTVQNSKARCNESDDDMSVGSVAGSSWEQNISQNSVQNHDDHIENVVSENHELEINGGLSEGMTDHSHLQNGASSGTNVLDLAFIKGESEKQRSQHQIMVSSDGVMLPHIVDDTPSEILCKESKSSVSNDLDEKVRAPVVQQRGRFKVTSENVDSEKELPSPMLQKSHRIQVVTQLPVLGQQPSSAARSSNPSGYSLYPQLHCILQTNILQRENILNLMKQISFGDSTGNRDGAHMPTTTLTEKSLLQLEAAHDRGKELLQEVTELQWRLICVQDELQKFKTKNAQE